MFRELVFCGQENTRSRIREARPTRLLNGPEVLMFLFFQCLENSVVEVDVDAVEAFCFNCVDGIRPAVLRPSDSFQGLEKGREI